MGIPILLDTDIGTDVDDAFALVMAVKESRLDLLGVTTVYCDVDLRARMARKILNILKRSQIPVAAGSSTPLYDGKGSYWGGWEGKRLLDKNEVVSYLEQGAVGFMRDSILASYQDVTLVGIGPLTNIAILIRDHPEVRPQIGEIICMAGTLKPGDEEWNVQCDPEAAKIIFTSGLPLTLGTRHFVNQPLLRQQDRKLLAESEEPINQVLVGLFDEFLSHKTRNYSPMYDPVTLSMAFTNAYLPSETQHFTIRDDKHIIHLVPSSINQEGAVAINVPQAVHPEAFIKYLIDLLLSND